MISGVETKSSDPLFQNINQTILNGDVWVDGAKQSKDSMKYKSVSKVYHDSAGYIFGNNRYPVILEKSVKSGNWKSLNTGGSSDILTKRLFSLNADLGSEVRNGSLCYTVLPDISLSDFEKYKIENVITILQNDAAVHAVYHKKLNQLQALFFEPATLKLPWKDLKVNFLHPGLLIIRKLENKIIVNYSQPTEKKEIVIDLNVKTKVENQDLTIF
jgi:chondroitin AC lyase